MKYNFSQFPLPYYLNGEKHPGSIIALPKKCQQCDGYCVLDKNKGIGLCSQGYNYLRIDNELVILGFILLDHIHGSATKKLLRIERHFAIHSQHLEQLRESLNKESENYESAIETSKREIIDSYVEKEQFKLDFLESIRKEITRSQSFVHDYKQLNTQISQSINVILEQKYTGNSIEEKLAQATVEEIAIYKAAKLMTEKLNVVKLLVNPHFMNKKEDHIKFRFHGVVRKYIGIYSSHITNKKLKVTFTGSSYGEIVCHPEACAVIPHTFIDNAIKYAPEESEIIIHVQDMPEFIEFSVSSFGPRIKPEEEEQIFQPYFRGEAARRQEEEGSGYGLYVSQLVAVNHFDQKIIVTQDPKQKPRFGHWTTFTIKIPYEVYRLL